MESRRGHAALPADRGGGGERLNAPARLDGIVDSHCHLQHVAFDADREAVIERARASGIRRLLVPGWDVASSASAVALAEAHPDLVDAAVGIHPHHAAAAGEPEWRQLEELADAPGVVAIGEIGLDHHRDFSPRDVQAAAFARQLTLAAARKLPVLVHDRDAHAAVSAALLGWPGDGDRRSVRGVLHCFSGDAGMADRLVAAGFLVSFALPLAFRSAVAQREAAARLAPGRILVETDSPWLAAGSDRRNEPVTVLRVAAELARLRGTSLETLAAEVAAAYDRLVRRNERSA